MSEINEIEAAAREHKRVREAAAANADALTEKRDRWPVVPIAIGVGSAALAAAFLYSGLGRKK